MRKKTKHLEKGFRQRGHILSLAPHSARSPREAQHPPRRAKTGSTMRPISHPIQVTSIIHHIDRFYQRQERISIAISKAMRAALKALSYPDIDIRKSYPLKRQIDTAVGKKIGAAYETWDHTVQCGDHEVPVRLFASGNGADDRILLFFHGGGWVTGNIDSYNKICCQMAEATGHLVVSVDYRLAPEHRFPQGLEDCYAVAREVCLDASLFGVSARRITLIGDSAGGNLAAAVSLMARDRGEFLPARQILIYPATWNDHTPASPFRSVTENGTDYLLTSRRICDYMELYRSSAADLQNPYFAPLLAEDFTGLPETLVVTAQYDPLRDEGEEYAARLAEAGGDVVCRRMPDALHGFLALPPQFAQVGRIYEWINAFLREREERV